MVRISQDEEGATFSIDLLKHNTTGEYYVVKYMADWENHGTEDDPSWHCIGGHVVEAAGPLHHSDVATIRTDPFNWDGDPEIDIVNDEYTWEEIYAGHR